MKKRYSIFLTLVVLVLMFYVLKDVDFIEAYKIFRQINIFYSGMAFLCYGCFFLLWNYRWKRNLSHLVDVDYWFLLKVLFSGIFVNTITPSANMGGEPVRAYFLSKKYDESKTKILGCIAADKFFHLSIFGVFFVVSVLFVLIFVEIPANVKIILEIALIILFVLIGIVGVLIWKRVKLNNGFLMKAIYKFRFVKRRFKEFKDFKEYVDNRISNIVGMIKKILSHRKSFYYGIFLSVGVWIFNYLPAYLLFHAFGSKVSFLSIVIVMTISILVGDVSPIPGGIGMIEGSMFLLYTAMGIPVSLAVIVTLLTRAIYYFYALLIGGLSLLYLRFRVK